MHLHRATKVHMESEQPTTIVHEDPCYCCSLRNFGLLLVFVICEDL